MTNATVGGGVMVKAIGALVVVTLTLALSSAQSPDEPCVKNAYPPDPRLVHQLVRCCLLQA